ncbi:RHS repeat-associated core domain protein [Striga asiatica]|uniref:RHS repeat-associated core domain protein n=1 Tax=Striga asiatica TaxID=4170 RepID=A0A5A7Q2E7_STRAF|nr:RHS repeat-associated core domain protein [Striga asiatica]
MVSSQDSIQPKSSEVMVSNLTPADGIRSQLNPITSALAFELDFFRPAYALAKEALGVAILSKWAFSSYSLGPVLEMLALSRILISSNYVLVHPGFGLKPAKATRSLIQGIRQGVREDRKVILGAYPSTYEQSEQAFMVGLLGNPFYQAYTPLYNHYIFFLLGIDPTHSHRISINTG